ncbi:Uncharacterized protein FWK35_00009830 [Aphis craccivora]|uniref:Uncharacterized protein n=1 Tax=Aphis craccivora TaxID=307492 RepID=A0A6G0YQU1_APHCR|nr:Uncharacterized protein FWK35_00009830 [Aphis craccivora]
MFKHNTFEVLNTYIIDEIFTQIELLDSAFNSYAKAHDELFQILEDDSELDSIIEQFENVSITYMRVKSNFISMLADKNVIDVHEVDRHIKLPSINLPQFSGKF